MTLASTLASMSTVEPPLASSSTLRPAAQPSPPLAARAPSLPTAASSSSAGGSRPIRSPADYASDQDDDGDDDNAHLVQERAPIPPFRKGHRPRASVAGLLDDAPTAFAAERHRRVSTYDGADAGIVEQVRAEWTRRTGAVRGVVRRNEGPFSLLSLLSSSSFSSPPSLRATQVSSSSRRRSSASRSSTCASSSSNATCKCPSGRYASLSLFVAPRSPRLVLRPDSVAFLAAHPHPHGHDLGRLLHLCVVPSSRRSSPSLTPLPSRSQTCAARATPTHSSVLQECGFYSPCAALSASSGAPRLAALFLPP